MRTVVLSASLIAFSVACGYAKLLLFPYLFFVELFTVAVFLSGLLMRSAWGAWIGAVARLVFSVANPYGPPHPWILIAQVVASAGVGALGGVLRPWLLSAGDGPEASRRRVAVLIAAGFAGTLLYDLLTNVAQGIAFGSVPATLALAALPAAQHIGSNVAIFAVAGNLSIPWLLRHPVASRHVV